MAVKVGQVVIELIANIAKFEDGIKTATKTLDSMGTKFKNAGESMTKGVTLPIVGLGVAAVKLAKDFESSFTGVIKTVNATEDELKVLDKGFRDLSKTIPLSVNELHKIGEAAGQLGIKTENILGFTKTMAELGATTNLSSDQAATALARMANIMGTAQTDFDRMGSTIVDLGNNFATTESEITEFGLRIAGAGKQVGLSEADVFSYAAALSSVGVEAEAGGTAVSMAFKKIAVAVASGGEKLESFASVAHMSAQDFKNLFEKDAALAMQKFIEGLGMVKSEGGNVFGVLDNLGMKQERLQSAMLRAAGAGELLSKTITSGRQAWIDNTALTREAELRFATFDSTLTLVKNSLKLAGVTLGETLIPIIKDQLLPVIQKTVEKISDFAEWFAKLPEPVQKTGVALLGLAAAVGPVLWGFGSMSKGLSDVLKLFKDVGLANSISKLVTKIKGAGGLVPALGSIGTVLTGPVGITVAVAAAAAALIAFAMKNEKVRELVMQAWSKIKEFFAGVWEGIKKGAEALGDWLGEIWSEHEEEFLEAWGNLKESAVAIWEKIKDGLASVWESIKEAFSSIVESIRLIWEEHGEKIKAVASAIWEGVKIVLDGVWNGITSGLTFVVDSLAAILGGGLEALSGVFNVFAGIFTLNWDTVSKGLNQIWSGIWDAIKGVFQAGAEHIIRMINWTIDQVNKAIPEKWEIPKIDIDFDSKPIEAAKTKTAELNTTFKGLNTGLDETKKKTGELTTEVDKNAKSLGNNAKAVKGLTDEQKKLKEATDKLINPVKELSKKYDDLIDLGYDHNTIMKLMGDDLEKAEESTEKFNTALSFEEQWLIDVAAEVRKLQSMDHLPGLISQVDNSEYAFNLLNNAAYEMNARFEQNQASTRALNYRLAELGVTGTETADIYERDMNAAWDAAGAGIMKLDYTTELFVEDWKRQHDDAKNKTNELGNFVSTTLTNMTQDIAEKVTRWAGPFQDFAKGAMSALLEGLFRPFTSMLTEMGNAVGNWVTSLLTGKGGGGLFSSIKNIFTGGGGGGILDLFTGGGKGPLSLSGVLPGGEATNSILGLATGKSSLGLLGTLGGGIASLLGIGGTAALPAVGVTSGILASATADMMGVAAMFPATAGVAGAAGAAGTAGAAGAGAAGSGGMMATIGGLLTNPITAIVAAGIGAAIGIPKLVNWISGPNSWQAGSKEIARDFGGIGLSDDVFKQFSEAAGISEAEAWPLRKNIISSPAFMAIMAAAAEQQGKLAEYLKSLEKVQTSWGAFNFRPALEQGLETGDFAELNKMWIEVSKMGGSAVKSVADQFENLLLPEAEKVTDTTADLTEQMKLQQVEQQKLNDQLAEEQEKKEKIAEVTMRANENFNALNETLVMVNGNVMTLSQALAQLQVSSTASPAAAPADYGGSFASGLSFAPRDMMAYIHRGERILTREQNMNYRSGDISLSFNLSGAGANLREQVRGEIIPMIVQHIYDSNASGIREAIRFAHNRVRGAYE